MSSFTGRSLTGGSRSLTTLGPGDGQAPNTGAANRFSDLDSLLSKTSIGDPEARRRKRKAGRSGSLTGTKAPINPAMSFLQSRFSQFANPSGAPRSGGFLSMLGGGPRTFTGSSRISLT
jgi:hypothetical protein